MAQVEAERGGEVCLAILSSLVILLFFYIVP